MAIPSPRGEARPGDRPPEPGYLGHHSFVANLDARLHTGRLAIGALWGGARRFCLREVDPLFGCGAFGKPPGIPRLRSALLGMTDCVHPPAPKCTSTSTRRGSCRGCSGTPPPGKALAGEIRRAPFFFRPAPRGGLAASPARVTLPGSYLPQRRCRVVSFE